MIIISENIVADIDSFLPKNEQEPIFILTDTNTAICCLPVLQKHPRLQNAHVITIPSGDENKNLNSLSEIWHYLSDNGATRHSLLINLGGGMITDMGGFAAATFKRGMNFINIPTSLLGAIDAATGGKTGINYLGFKNEIGSFASAKAVIVNSQFLTTLDTSNLLSGFAEMVKHALIADTDLLYKTLNFDLDNIDYKTLVELIKANLEIKAKIVAEDPHELGMRKALNFGHTFGHAFETLSHKTNEPMLHGYAVMWGLVCELYLSHIELQLPQKIVTDVLYFAKENYGIFPFSCKQYDDLFELMKHDKKNEAQEINFTLLSDIGQVKINNKTTKNAIFETLDWLQSM
ncbi:MAG TPA: 3-dehydroquinate synthase [Paludibacteraceae bacterium]|nr:3-dehydroquinate synthase [Paludibacteraceae bacterium]